MSNRLTRKAIKRDIRQDEIRSSIEVAIDWIYERRRQLTIAACAVVVLALLGVGVSYTLDLRRESAEELLAKAMKVADAPIVKEGAKPEDAKDPSFASEEDRRQQAQALLDEVSGAPKGLAELYLANYAFADGDLDKARALWQSFQKNHGDNLLGISVRLNLIRLERQDGDAAKLAEELRKELAGPTKTLPEDVLIFELAETLAKLGQGEEADELYHRLLDEYPQSGFAGRAREATADDA